MKIREGLPLIVVNYLKQNQIRPRNPSATEEVTRRPPKNSVDKGRKIDLIT